MSKMISKTLTEDQRDAILAHQLANVVGQMNLDRLMLLIADELKQQTKNGTVHYQIKKKYEQAYKLVNQYNLKHNEIVKKTVLPKKTRKPKEKLGIGWTNSQRGGGLVSSGYDFPDGSIHWFVISRSRIGERLFYLRHLSTNNGKLSDRKILSVGKNVSAARVADAAADFIRWFVLENKGRLKQ